MQIIDELDELESFTTPCPSRLLVRDRYLEDLNQMHSGPLSTALGTQPRLPRESQRTHCINRFKIARGGESDLDVSTIDDDGL